MTVAQAPARPFFLEVGARRIFALHHEAAANLAGGVRGGVLYLPPFVEEMNKSRRMAALQSRALAAHGYSVLQIDFCGCGDSEGDFADATWASWLDDVAAARQWLERRVGSAPWLWGLRLGALLASASVARDPQPVAGLLLWQPVVSGRQHLQQFLRLRAGADWIGEGRQGAAEPKAIDRLSAGEPVEVAGYLVDPGLALPMADCTLQLPATLPRIGWLEVSPREGATLSPAAEKLLAPLRTATEVRASVVQGPSFWQATEIETVPALLPATLAVLA